jgi:hypothetical protein
LKKKKKKKEKEKKTKPAIGSIHPNQPSAAQNDHA